VIERTVIFAVGNPNHQSQLTFNRAHAMLPALGKPLVVRMMDRLYRAGIRQYTVIVGVNEGAVASYLNTNWVPNAQIEFVIKTANDTVSRIVGNIARKYQKPLLITSYNSFTHAHVPDSLLKQHQADDKALVLSGAPTTLSKSKQHYYALRENSNVTAVLTSRPGEARTLTLADMAVCGQSFVDYVASSQLKTGTFHHQFMDIVQQYVASKGATQIIESAWNLQIETDHDLLTLNKLLLDEGQDAHILSELPYTVQVIPPVRIDPQVSVGQGAKIGPHVYLERGANVGHETVVRNSIILQQAKVPPKTTITDVIFSSRGTVT
jgi:NDP-sugar pyrophosphorylase family protein